MEPTMKRNTFLFLIMGLLVCVWGYAEETNPEAIGAIPTAISETLPEDTTTDEDVNTDNLEFISGEIGELDEAGKTILVKLYGETETAKTDKTLKVSVDASTDITDGEQERDFKSLAVGTEVDVEYDPANNKATYIFIY
jgi:hypothetical protein